MGLLVHFWTVFQTVLFRDKFKFIILYYRIFTKNFSACMHTMLLLFYFLVSLLGMHDYLYWYEQYEKSCFLFKVKVHNYITIHLSMKVGIKLHLHILICLFKSFVNVHVPLR